MSLPAGPDHRDALADAAASWLETPAGQAALAAAVAVTLQRIGAPTRPGGAPGRLADRLARREPLCEDTDWECPLGPFRDTSIARGTLAELCAARLTDLSFGLGALVNALLALAPPHLAGLASSGALDQADARSRLVDGLATALLGPLRAQSVARLLGEPQPT